jgi:hypothetical protein
MSSYLSTEKDYYYSNWQAFLLNETTKLIPHRNLREQHHLGAFTILAVLSEDFQSIRNANSIPQIKPLFNSHIHNLLLRAQADYDRAIESANLEQEFFNKAIIEILNIVLSVWIDPSGLVQKEKDNGNLN